MLANREIGSLHPKMRALVIPLQHDLIRAYEAGHTKSCFKVFECFRSSERQNDLFRRKATKAREWQSAHNYGLAVDFVPANFLGRPYRVGEKELWSWDNNHDWDFLRKCAHFAGLKNTIDWDRAHCEHPIWDKIKINVI